MFNSILKIYTQVPVIVLLLLAASSVITGDYLAKSWSINRGTGLFVLALIFYSLSGVLYVPTLFRQGLVVTSLIWNFATMDRSHAGACRIDNSLNC